MRRYVQFSDGDVHVWSSEKENSLLCSDCLLPGPIDRLGILAWRNGNARPREHLHFRSIHRLQEGSRVSPRGHRSMNGHVSRANLVPKTSKTSQVGVFSLPEEGSFRLTLCMGCSAGFTEDCS